MDSKVVCESMVTQAKSKGGYSERKPQQHDFEEGKNEVE